MDWQIFVPFIPFFATFFGVLAAFGLQWYGKHREKESDRKRFLKDIRHELETGSTYLTGAAQLLPTDMWESGKASGFLTLLSHEVKTKLATAYFAIGSHNYESVKLRDVSILAATTTSARAAIKLGDKTAKVPIPFTPAQLLHQALTVRLVDTEKGVKKLIDDLLKEDIWE